MRYRAVATDYDNTLAEAGRVAPATVAALHRARQSGRKLILVTGRELPDLQNVFPEFGIFDRVVAENGAVLLDPASHTETQLSSAVPGDLVAALRKRGVPLSQGRVILASEMQYLGVVSDAIERLQVDVHIVLNKGSVMVLPDGVDKLTGLDRALEELQVPFENVVGIGDAENDRAFLAACGCAVAVANALAEVRDVADIVTGLPAGRGVVELIDQLLANDLALDPLRRGH